MPASPVLGEGDTVIGVGGLHLVLELPLSEDGCIWAGPPLVDPPIQVPLQEPSICLLIERVPLYSVCGHWQVRDQFI